MNILNVLAKFILVHSYHILSKHIISRGGVNHIIARYDHMKYILSSVFVFNVVVYSHSHCVCYKFLFSKITWYCRYIKNIEHQRKKNIHDESSRSLHILIKFILIKKACIPLSAMLCFHDEKIEYTSSYVYYNVMFSRTQNMESKKCLRNRLTILLSWNQRNQLISFLPSLF